MYVRMTKLPEKILLGAGVLSKMHPLTVMRGAACSAMACVR